MTPSDSTAPATDDPRAAAVKLRGAHDQTPFSRPWELRAFAVAVAAHEQELFVWPDLQQSLIKSIRNGEDTSRPQEIGYYEHWLNALEAVLAEQDLLTEPQLNDRAQAVLHAPRNANHHPATTEPIAIDPAVKV